MPGNFVRVTGLVVKFWKFCARSRNAVLVSGYCAETLETLFLSADLVLRRWKRGACQRIWCWDVGNILPVGGFGVETLETLCLSADLVLRRWKRYACQRIWRWDVGNAARVSGFGVEKLKTLCLSADLVLRRWKRYACQRDWCWDVGNVVHISVLNAETLETLSLSADFAVRRCWSFENDMLLCLSTELVLRRWKRCACQRIWCWQVRNVVPVSRFSAETLETLCLSVDGRWKRCVRHKCGIETLKTLRLSADWVLIDTSKTLSLSANLAFRSWQRYDCQQIWRWNSGNIAPVSGFGVETMETFYASADLVLGCWNVCACQSVCR